MASEQMCRTVSSIRWKAKGRVVSWPDRIDGVPSYPAPLPLAAPPCTTTNQTACSVSEFWVRQIFHIILLLCASGERFKRHVFDALESTIQKKIVPRRTILLTNSPARSRLAIPPCAPTRPARDMSGFLVRQISITSMDYLPNQKIIIISSLDDDRASCRGC